jgi:uncharacterized Zn finger protein (UPF0148 family)
MTPEENTVKIKELMRELNDDNHLATLHNELYGHVMQNMKKAIETCPKEEEQKKLYGIAKEFQEKTGNIVLGKFKIEEATVAPKENSKEKEIMELIKGVKREVSKNMWEALKHIKEYQDDISDRKTLAKYPELKPLIDLNLKGNNNLSLQMIMNITEKIINSTQHAPAKEVCKAIQRRTLEYALYFNLFMIFNHPETEYMKILQTYKDRHTEIANMEGRLNAEPRKEAKKVMDKIHKAIELYAAEMQQKN